MSYLEYNLGHPAPSLKSAWPIAKEALRDFATGPNFCANLETAFGNDLDSQKAAALAAEWGAGDFSGLPEIEVRPGGEINGAMGAFSGDTNTIYFSQEYLSANAGNGEAVAGVWLEEVGHFVDSVVNSEDAAGDEGEIFSRLVRGDVLSGLELELLRGEDDGAVVVLDGVERAIEMAKIGFGVPVSGSIKILGEEDGYTFEGKAGDKISLSIGSVDISPELRVFAPDGSLLAEKSIFEGEVNLLESLKQSGTYTVLASDQDSAYTGDYGLTIQRANNPNNATAIKFGVPVSGSIENFGYEKTYTFEGKAGDKISLSLGSVDISPELRVLAPDGSLLAEKSVFEGEVNLLESLKQSGTYTVLASDQDSAYTGDYGLTIQRANNPSNATAIKFGVPVSGSIENFGYEKTYTFEGKAGDKISLSLGSVDISPELRVLAPDGSLLAEKSVFEGEVNLLESLKQSGTYTVLASDQDSAYTGDYGLTIQRIGGNPNPEPPKNPTGSNKKDNLIGSNKKDNINGKGGNDKISGGGGNDKLNGGGGKDNLNGGRGKDNLIGGKGNDVLNGGKGADTLKGGPGNDIYFIDNTRDRVIEIFGGTATGGSATATARGDTVNTSVSVTASTATRSSAWISQFVENIILTGKKAINATAGKGSNDITGNRAKNIINSGSGDDNVSGGGGNDMINAGSGDDNVNGDGGNDILNGGSGNDNLVGDKGKDKLTGGSGNDTLVGGADNDTLIGGGGKDRFLYQSNRRFRSQDFGTDRIVGFVTGEDDIILDKTTFNSLESKAGNSLVKNDFATIKGKASAARSSAEIVYNSSTGELFYNANGSAAGFGGGGKFATLTNEPALSRSDFMVQN